MSDHLHHRVPSAQATMAEPTEDVTTVVTADDGSVVGLLVRHVDGSEEIIQLPDIDNLIGYIDSGQLGDEENR